MTPLLRWQLIRTLSVLVVAAVTVRADDPFFSGLGYLPGGNWASPTSISADGTSVVGVGHNGLGYLEAWRWTTDDGMVGLGALPGRSGSWAHGVSGDGSIVVGDSYPPTEAVRWNETEGMLGLGDLAGGDFHSVAFAVSADSSVIVGHGTSEDSHPSTEAFRWTEADGMIGLGGFPGSGNSFSRALGVSADGRVIVGWGHSLQGDEAFRWTTEEGMVGLGDLPGGAFDSQANAVSADGRVVVGTSSSDHIGVEAFRWTAEEGMLGLGALDDSFFLSHANAVSGDGSIIVGDSIENFHNAAFIWDEQHGMRNLQTVLTDDYDLDLGGWELHFAYGISADGKTIVGSGWNPLGQTEPWIAHIPEPATLWLLSLAGFARLLRDRVRV